MSTSLNIQLNNAGKRFNRNWIFRKLNLDLEAGKKLAITGSNGSGKSTLLQCLCGYQQLSEGRLIFSTAGGHIADDRLYTQFSLATPYLELPEAYTLQEMIGFHFSLKSRKANFDLETALSDSGLAMHRNKAIMYFSSGMKQRLKLLLAFGSDVPLILLDEPTTNLDKSGIQWYHKLIEGLNTYPNQTLIIASNQPDEYSSCSLSISIEDFN